MTASNPHALTGAYVLDALEPDERHAFEAHLPTCQDCRIEVVSLRAAAARMGAAQAVEPPPGLHDAVRAQVRRTAQVPPSASVRPAAAEPAHPTTRRTRPVRLLAVAASVALLVTAGGTVAIRAQQAQRADQVVQAQVMRIMSAPDMESHDLGPGPAHLVLSTEMDAAAVMGSDVPMPADGLVYQVWMMHDDGSMAAGPTFVPRDGEVTAVVEGEFSDLAAIMVTEEPPGGSPEPTGGYLAELHL